jgi:hypothetical protein
MKRIPFLLLISFTGLVQAQADSFARHISDDHLLYVETRDIPGYRIKMAQTPIAKVFEEIDWKELTVQLVEVARQNLESPSQDTPSPSPEDLRTLLVRVEKQWQDISSHLSGDMAFAMGSFESVLETIEKNKSLRMNLWEPDAGPVGDAQEEDLQQRLLEEAQLDSSELNSLLGQFSWWMQVKDGVDLETKLENLFSNLLQQQTTSPLELQSLTWNDQSVYALTPALSEKGLGLYWAIYKDTWLITLNEEKLRENLSRLDQAPENALTSSPAFQDAATFVGDTDAFIYFNPARIDTLLRRFLPESAGPNPMGLPTTEALLNWLALDALLPYTSGSELSEQGFLMKSRMGFTRETSLSRIVIDPNNSPARIPAFLHRDFYQISSSHWHIGEGWNRLEKELMTLAPQAAAGMGMARMLATAQLGFDLKLQFFDHLAGGLVFVQSLDPEVMEAMARASQQQDPANIMKVSMEHPTGGQNFLFGLELHNKTEVEEAMQRLMSRMHPQGVPEPETFANHLIYSPIPDGFQGGMFTGALTFAFTDEYLLIAIGNPDLLKQALDAQSDEELQLRNHPPFTSLRARFPDEAQTLEYATSEQQLNGLRMMEVSLSMLQEKHPDLQLPDLQKLAGILDRTIGITTRKGLVFEQDMYISFSEDDTVPAE